MILKLFIFVGFFIFSVDQASAFTTLRTPSGGATTGRPSADVVFDIDTSCNSYRNIVDSAIRTANDTWGAVPTSNLTISIGKTVTLPSPISTYVGSSATQYAPIGNTIVYCDTVFANGGDPNSNPGFAGATNFNSSNQIQGGLLVLNFKSGAQSSLEVLDATTANIVLTHEIGHCIGIGHSSDSNSLMYFSTSAGRQNVLSKDDMDAVTFLYPKKDMTGALACGRVKNIAGGAEPPLNLWPFATEMLLFLLFLLAVSRRKILSPLLRF